MKTLSSTLLLTIATLLLAQQRDVAVGQPEPPNGNGTYQVKERLTLPDCLEFRWNKGDKSKLPIAIQIRNPFLEPITVIAEIHGDPCAEFEIEYYDSYLKGWRRFLGLPGSSAGKLLSLKYGEHKELPIAEGYWNYVYRDLQSFKLEEPVRIRLVFDLGDGTSLQSPELKWSRIGKKVIN